MPTPDSTHPGRITQDTHASPPRRREPTRSPFALQPLAGIETDADGGDAGGQSGIGIGAGHLELGVDAKFALIAGRFAHEGVPKSSQLCPPGASNATR